MTVTNTYNVAGMTCGACEKMIAMKVKKIAGLSDVAVRRDTGSLIVQADRTIPVEEMQQALAGTDYQVTQ